MEYWDNEFSIIPLFQYSITPVLPYLQKISGFFFYLLTSSFFLAWILLHNKIQVHASATWMQVADLPLAFSAIVYGGLSVYRSLHHPEQPSRALAWMIGIPLAIFFGLILVMNFWH